MKPDPIVEEVRKHRREVFRKAGYKLEPIFERAREWERRVYEVSLRADGQWQVKGRANERAASVHATKKGAVQAAQELVSSGVIGELIIHGRDGKIQAKNTYGRDPYPAKAR